MAEPAYQLGCVGRERHPELYSEKPIASFYETVEEEQRLWEAAEEIEEKLGWMRVHQLFLVWHMVCALRGLNKMEEAGWYDWMKSCLWG